MSVDELKEAVQKYHIDELVAQSKVIFGVNPEVVRGAVYGIGGEEFAVDEVRKLIDAFLKRRVI